MNSRNILFALLAGIFLFCGTACVQTYDLSNEQIDAAYEKYAPWSVIKNSDSFGCATAKVFGRGLLDIITIALFEIEVYESKNHACHMYYLDTFLGKKKHDVIVAFGAPDRISSDGNGGEALSYIVSIVSGNKDYVSTTYRKTTFLINADGIVYQRMWQVQ